MVDPPVELLEYRPFKDLARALRARSSKILQRWEHLVRTTLPAAEELTLSQLRDDLPRVLEQMSLALEADRPAATHELMEMTRPHGEVRFHQNYNISELLIEYQMLRRTITEDVAQELGRPLEVGEIVAMNMAIDVALSRGIIGFVTFQTRELKAATAAESKYLSFLSHDLRGSLNGVILMLELLKRELEPRPEFTESVSDLDMMRRSILETVTTMDRLLQAEKLRRGKMPVRIGPVDVQKLAADIASQFSHQAKEKGVDLDVQVPDKAVIESDRDLLTLVLSNLVGNAVKYTPAGKVAIHLRNGAMGWELSVADSGPGIPADKLGTLFEPYVRGDTHGQAGVGLGLSIARQAADLLGAKLSAESKVGKGATFTLNLAPGGGAKG